MRMAVEIGLHLSCDRAIASNKFSIGMSEVRKLVFWGCYVQDKYVFFYRLRTTLHLSY
jgi:hypothetical protein